MPQILRVILDRAVCDERGAELVEWIVWVAAIAAIGVALVAPLQTGITTAINAVLKNIPSAGS